MERRSLKLLHAFLMLLLQLKPALGFISRVEDAKVRCIESERQALPEFKRGLVVLLMTMVGSLHGEAKMKTRIAATGKEFIATSKQAMYSSLIFRVIQKKHNLCKVTLVLHCLNCII